MALIRFAAGSLVLFTLIISVLGDDVGTPDNANEWQVVHPQDLDDDETDPSQMLAFIHEPNELESSIHHISRTLLTVTKDLISYAPRSKDPNQQKGTRQKLNQLETLRPDEVKTVLSQYSVSVPQARNVTCGYGTQFYRTMDGSCNNVLYPCWGKAEEAYLRWLPPAYDNGIDEPRNTMKNGYPLPNPRLVYQWVSSQFEPNPATTYQSFSNLLVFWGQAVAHDIILTPTVTVSVWTGTEFKKEKPHCCDTRTTHSECIPIIMNYEDGYYPKGHCMDIVRSTAYMYNPRSCSPLSLGKARQQMNQLTPFLDASLVYGTSEKEMRRLREHGGLGGEKRANENPILGAIHTLLSREHNRLVDLLRVKGWPEETLFHVVRKIVGAMLQHTTYKEYLPLILGQTLSNAMKLTVPTQSYKYDPYVNPSIYNVFAAAAFRYGHSMISTRHSRAGRWMDNNPLLSQDFFSMDDFCNQRDDSVANLIYGQLQQKVQKVDCLFSKEMTNHLFAKRPSERGLDIFSLNIQRGRDHGIPPYNEWREVCGLRKAKNYADLKGTIPDYVLDRLEKVYGPGNVNEIDLFVGGISELPVNDGILGPTFTCIVANQFVHLKTGDRFWYENLDHPGAFTAAQIASIQKTTVASLLCRNSGIKEMPRSAFLLESTYNPKVSCDSIVNETDIDIRLW